jgi:hypothetical protein
MSISQNKYNNYNEQIDTLQSQFQSALTDYKNAYVLYNSNPDFNEYKSTFFSIQQNLQNMNSKLFILVNDIEKSIDDLNYDVSTTNSDIDQEKIKYKTLGDKLKLASGETGSMEIMINNYKDEYFYKYVKNTTTILGICITMFYFTRTFKLR